MNKFGSTVTDPDCVVRYSMKRNCPKLERTSCCTCEFERFLFFLCFSRCQNRVRVDSSPAWSVCQFVLARLTNTRRVTRRIVLHLISSHHLSMARPSHLHVIGIIFSVQQKGMIRLFSRYVDQDAFVAGFVDKRIPHFYRERTEFPEHQRRCSGAVLRMVFLLDELLLFLSCGQFASCCSIF